MTYNFSLDQTLRYWNQVSPFVVFLHLIYHIWYKFILTFFNLCHWMFYINSKHLSRIPIYTHFYIFLQFLAWFLLLITQLLHESNIWLGILHSNPFKDFLIFFFIIIYILDSRLNVTYQSSYTFLTHHVTLESWISCYRRTLFPVLKLYFPTTSLWI